MDENDPNPLNRTLPPDMIAGLERSLELTEALISSMRLRNVPEDSLELKQELVRRDSLIDFFDLGCSPYCQDGQGFAVTAFLGYYEEFNQLNGDGIAGA